MKLRQLQYLHQVIQEGFNVSAAAQALHTAQPGVSKQLRAFADELGVELFRYQGKRLVGLTAAGERIVPIVERMLKDMERIREAAADAAEHVGERLVVVASRYMAEQRVRLAMSRFRLAEPNVRLRLFEAEPSAAARLLTDGDAHVGILPEYDDIDRRLAQLELDRWHLGVVVTERHPLTQHQRLSLADLADYSLCTYECGAASRQRVDAAFSDAGIESPVAFALGSSASILDYVECGAGVGIVANVAFDATRRPSLRLLDARHLFAPLTTCLVLPRLQHQPQPEILRRFLELLAPELDISRVLDRLGRAEGSSAPQQREALPVY